MPRIDRLAPVPDPSLATIRLGTSAPISLRSFAFDRANSSPVTAVTAIGTSINRSVRLRAVTTISLLAEVASDGLLTPWGTADEGTSCAYAIAQQNGLTLAISVNANPFF